jgi:hypothetical protein
MKLEQEAKCEEGYFKVTSSPDLVSRNELILVTVRESVHYHSSPSDVHTRFDGTLYND